MTEFDLLFKNSDPLQTKSTATTTTSSVDESLSKANTFVQGFRFDPNAAVRVLLSDDTVFVTTVSNIQKLAKGMELLRTELHRDVSGSFLLDSETTTPCPSTKYEILIDRPAEPTRCVLHYLQTNDSSYLGLGTGLRQTVLSELKYHKIPYPIVTILSNIEPLGSETSDLLDVLVQSVCDTLGDPEIFRLLLKYKLLNEVLSLPSEIPQAAALEFLRTGELALSFTDVPNLLLYEDRPNSGCNFNCVARMESNMFQNYVLNPELRSSLLPQFKVNPLDNSPETSTINRSTEGKRSRPIHGNNNNGKTATLMERFTNFVSNSPGKRSVEMTEVSEQLRSGPSSSISHNNSSSSSHRGETAAVSEIQSILAADSVEEGEESPGQEKERSQIRKDTRPDNKKKKKKKKDGKSTEAKKPVESKETVTSNGTDSKIVTSPTTAESKSHSSKKNPELETLHGFYRKQAERWRIWNHRAYGIMQEQGVPVAIISKFASMGIACRSFLESHNCHEGSDLRTRRNLVSHFPPGTTSVSLCDLQTLTPRSVGVHAMIISFSSPGRVQQ